MNEEPDVKIDDDPPVKVRVVDYRPTFTTPQRASAEAWVFIAIILLALLAQIKGI